MRGTLVRSAPADRLRLSLRAGPVSPSAATWAVRITAVMALVPIAIYVWIALHRIGYPYELDWLEGGAVELVGRAMHGQSLYTAPTLAYVGYTYPPLYTWVSAAVAELTGLGFLPLRLVSFVSSLIATAVLWRYVLAATADWAAGVVAAGIFAATYGLTGWWFDIGRLDSLFLALALLALWLGRGARGVRGGAAVGAVAFLAFFTKQIALVAVLPALGWLALARPRAGLAGLATLVGLLAASTLLLDGLTHGWYRYFVVSELAGQPWVHAEWVGFWRRDLYEHLWPLAWLIAAALGGGGLVALRPRRRTAARVRRWPGIRRPSGDPIGIGYDLSAAVGLLIAAWFSRLHTGGYLNVLMPAYAACALLGGVAFARMRHLGHLPSIAAVALVLVQLCVLIALPDHALPARSQRTAGAELISALRALPGPVLILNHPWYGTLAGKGSFAQDDAIHEVLRSDAARGATELRSNLRDALDRYRVAAVVLDGAPPSWLAPQLSREFVLLRHSVTTIPLRPPADLRSAPTQVYVRRALTPPPR